MAAGEAWASLGAMKRALVIQHVAMEGPARVAELCAERGIAVEIRYVYEGDPVPGVVAEDQGLIVMGGGMGVGDLDDVRYPFLRSEVALISSALAAGRPLLGICLGAQLLAHAAGARVYPHVVMKDGQAVRVREVGWGPVTFTGQPGEAVLAGLGAEEMVLHWHGDTFDLPAGAVHLASTPVCSQQAFRLGTRAYGLQFHVECDGPTACRWAVEDADFVRAARGPNGPALVIAESAHAADAARAAGDRLIRNILAAMAA